MNLFVGTSGYSYKPWRGSFYPEKLPEKQMLRFYGEQFNAVESNDTFRGVPKASVLETRAGNVPANFQFALKAPQQITNFKRLKDADEVLASFLDVAEVLKKHLGPILFQLPKNFKKDAARLRDFLPLMSGHRAAFEFRNQSWFDDEVFQILRDHNAALCIAEAEVELEIPFVSTADWGYLRLRMPEYSTRDLNMWVKHVMKQGWSDAFVFFKHEDEGRGPQIAKRLLASAAKSGMRTH